MFKIKSTRVQNSNALSFSGEKCLGSGSGPPVGTGGGLLIPADEAQIIPILRIAGMLLYCQWQE